MRKGMVVVLLSVVAVCFACSAKEIVVTSTADSGAGTLRWALQTARSGDTITFDPSVFPPDDPATIYLRSQLTIPWAGRITIDASEAGVILDGTHVPLDAYGFNFALLIPSDSNVVMGLQIVNLFGAGIGIHGGHNTIGGDRNKGTGPIGQGNLLSGNGTGIILWDIGRENALLGNLVGTKADGTTAWGNDCRGIWIENGAPKTQIGPNNVVAHNGCGGVVITGSRASGNSISQNVIHSNDVAEILLLEGGNQGVKPPAIFDVDLAAGMVTGSACGNCTVEVFSGTSGQGEVYEGTTRADGSGVFTLKKDSPLVGSLVVASATDRSGNSSAFSLPATAKASLPAIQQGSDRPRATLEVQQSHQLLDNRIGVDLLQYEPTLWDSYSDPAIADEHGFKWVRISAIEDPLNWQNVDLGNGEYRIDPEVDAVVTEYTNLGINLLLNLTCGIDILGTGKDCPDTARFRSEGDIQRYCEYVRFIVDYFRGRIRYYEIWNEPNAYGAPHGDVALRDYIRLVKHLVPVIRETDPTAKVVVGAVCGWFEPAFPGYGTFDRYTFDLEWLEDLITSGVAPLVDVISWHPMYCVRADDPYWQKYPEMIRDIQGLAKAEGFIGEYLAEEILWKRHREEGEPGTPVSSTVAAKYYARAVIIHRGLDVIVSSNLWNIAAPVEPIHTAFKTLCTAMAGAEPITVTAFHTGDAVDVVTCGFRLASGDVLVAIWSDNLPKDRDLGVPGTLKLPGLTAERIVGIDVLHGFDQELAFEIVNGSTVVRDLLIKDYPILLRLSGVTESENYQELLQKQADRDGDGVPDEEDYCPDYPGDPVANGC